MTLTPPTNPPTTTPEFLYIYPVYSVDELLALPPEPPEGDVPAAAPAPTFPIAAAANPAAAATDPAPGVLWPVPEQAWFTLPQVARRFGYADPVYFRRHIAPRLQLPLHTVNRRYYVWGADYNQAMRLFWATGRKGGARLPSTVAPVRRATDPAGAGPDAGGALPSHRSEPRSG